MKTVGRPGRPPSTMQLRPEEVTLPDRSVVERSAACRNLPRAQRLRLGGFIGYVGVVTLLFGRPLAGLFDHAVENDLHSHIPLVPLIAGYLLFLRRGTVAAPCTTSLFATAGLAPVGIAAVAASVAFGGRVSVNDHLALMSLGYISFVAAGGFLFLGSRWMAAAAFPIAFMIFLVPLPDAVVHWLETASVIASAEAASALFRMSGTLMIRDGTLFELPGISLRVAEECSGIRSSWALFITSVLASHLVLQSPWRRIVLVAFVIPLAIVRNGFRILVIGLLCVHVGPHMIDSPIHHRGGPLFFALSLVPLFLLLLWLRRGEQRRTLSG
jgi:exosortase C (VPDSG-CTERM-specific)